MESGDGKAAGKPVGHQQTVIKALLALATVLLTVRLAWLVHQYAVDLLYWDEWDIWVPLFDKADPWTMWRLQFGPQRQGLGEWIIALTARATRWNVQAQSLVATFVLFLAALVGLATVRSLRGRWSVADCLVPAIVLSATLVSVLTPVCNLSHGPLPLLLSLTCGYFAQVTDARTRVVGFALTTALCVQTGFTWMIVVVAVPFLLVLLVSAIRARSRVTLHVLALAVVLVSLSVFFYGFKSMPAAFCFRFPHPEPSRYLSFVGVMVLRAAQFVVVPARPVGVLLALFGACLVGWSGWMTIKTTGKDRLAAAVLVLSAFSLAFAANSAVGRICLGVEAGEAGRYVPYMLPLAIAAYLWLSLWPRFRRLRTGFIIGCFILVGAKETVFVASARAEAAHYTQLKTAFRDCYREGTPVAECNARWPIHPDPLYIRLQDRLDYLRDHRLSFYRDPSR